MIPTFVETWIVSSFHRLTNFGGCLGGTNHRKQSSCEDYLNSNTDINKNISSIVNDTTKSWQVT
jgi:hypothetical protein